MEQYDPILRARREALARVEEQLNLNDREYALAERAMDVFFDCIEEAMRDHDGELSIHQETGMLLVTCKEHDSNSQV